MTVYLIYGELANGHTLQVYFVGADRQAVKKIFNKTYLELCCTEQNERSWKLYLIKINEATADFIAQLDKLRSSSSVTVNTMLPDLLGQAKSIILKEVDITAAWDRLIAEFDMDFLKLDFKNKKEDLIRTYALPFPLVGIC